MIHRILMGKITIYFEEKCAFFQKNMYVCSVNRAVQSLLR